MISHSLIRKERISSKAAYTLIMLMAKRGNHHLDKLCQISFQTDDDVKDFFSKEKVKFEMLLDFCRDYRERIPMVENLLGSMVVMGGRAIITSTYWHLYESSSENLSRAIERVSFADLQSAATSGVASIEAFMNQMAEEWNANHPNNLLLDSKTMKVSFDNKIDNWIPIITGGKRFDKGNRNWADFKLLRGIRDNVTIHAKESSYVRSVYDIAQGINIFRTGIAGSLIQLHDLFDVKIPSIIIRDYFAPEVEVIETGL